MFPFGKKKKDTEPSKLKIKGDGEDRKKSKKSEKDQGPAWVSLVILGLSVLAGVFFWVYGELSRGGFVGVGSGNDRQEKSKDSGGQTRNDGVIIFEK